MKPSDVVLYRKNLLSIKDSILQQNAIYDFSTPELLKSINDDWVYVTELKNYTIA